MIWGMFMSVTMESAVFMGKNFQNNEINNRHRVLLLLLLHGGVGKVHGGLLIPMKVTMEMNQVLTEQGDLLYKYLKQFFRA